MGGSHRQESVFNALKLSSSDIVVIHDGARPMIRQEYIVNSLLELNNFPGTSIAVKSKDTIKITDDNGVVTQTTQRSNTWVIQTPQCFNREILMNCYLDQKISENLTDDCMLLEQAGHRIKLISGDYTNIKITTQEDIRILAELISR